jgi:TetR/AcrR family transcriptional repressor of nem operon
MGRPKTFEPDVAIECAMQTFWTRGYAATSPADLAEATGVGKGSLYHEFGSKRELFGKALECYGRLGDEAATAVFDEPGTAKERITAFLRSLVDADLDGPERRGCLAANTALELAGRDAEAERAVQRIAERALDLIAARIERGKRDGDVAADVDTRTQALLIQNTVSGLRISVACGFERPALYAIIDAAVAGL